MPMSKISKRLNNAMRNIPNSVFSAYATISTFSLAFVVAVAWCLLISILFFWVPMTTNTFWENVVVNTFITNANGGTDVYRMKTEAWLRSHAPCAANIERNATSYEVLGLSDPSEAHIAPHTVALRDRIAACDSAYARLDPQGRPHVDEDALLEAFSEATGNVTWTDSPFKCECTANGFDVKDHFKRWTMTFYQRAWTENVNGWHEAFDLQGNFEDNARTKGSDTIQTVTCCRCARTDVHTIGGDPLTDFCGPEGTKDLEFYYQGGSKWRTYIGWDFMHFLVMLGCSFLPALAVGVRYFLRNHGDIFMYTVLVSVPSYTLSGACMMHYIYKLGLLPKATGQLVVAILCLWLGSRMLGKRVVDPKKAAEREPQPFTLGAYQWSIIGASAISIFVGPFLITVSIGKIYVDQEASDALRTFISVFAVPIVFWLICTLGRFSAYEVAKYGRFDKSPMIYSVYSRTFVAGTSGTTDVVGYSFADRSNLFISSFLSASLGVLARCTTVQRDRFMYYAWHRGRQSLPKKYFENKHVAQFLQCDMLIFESFIDSVALTVVTFVCIVIEIYAGVPPTEAATGGFINWTIQMFIEQIGNYFIFLLRQRGGHIVKITPSDAEALEESRGDSVGAEETEAAIKGLGYFNVVNAKVWRVISNSWWLFLIAPFISTLLLRIVGPNTMRGMAEGFAV
eukprot:g2926.t1